MQNDQRHQIRVMLSPGFLEIVIFRNTGLQKSELIFQKLVWKRGVGAQNEQLGPIELQPWSMVSGHHPSAQTPPIRRGKEELCPAARLLTAVQEGGHRGSSTCHRLWWDIWSFCRAHFGMSFCGTYQHPQNSCSSELSKVTHEVQVVISCLMAQGVWKMGFLPC